MNLLEHLSTQISRMAHAMGHGQKGSHPRSACNHPSYPSHTSYEVEELVEMIRLNLYNRDLPHGPRPIGLELRKVEVRPLPSERKIARILSARGLTHGRMGRYEPQCNDYPHPKATRPGDVHQTGFAGPFPLGQSGEDRFYCLHSVDIATGRCAVEPLLTRGGQEMVNALWAIWDRLGVPCYEQVNNEPAFYGTSHRPRSMGKLIRLCLLHQVQPLFIPLGQPLRSPLTECLNQSLLLWLADRPLPVCMEAARDDLLSFERCVSLFRPSHELVTHSFLDASVDDSTVSGVHAATGSCTSRLADPTLRRPPSSGLPSLPLPVPTSGRYHLVRYVGQDHIVDLFGERLTMPRASTYTYVTISVDRHQQRLFVDLDGIQIGACHYPMS